MAKKRKIEIVIILAVLIIAAVLMYVKKSMGDRTAQEETLIDELRAVRSSVILYLEVNKSVPTSLKSLTTEKFRMKGGMKPYLSNVETDKEGYPVDPFGKQLGYDPKTGHVWPAEKAYAGW